MINLITSFYISRFHSELNNDRNDELRQCLNKNLENDFIEKIHLYVDDDEAFDYVKTLNNDKITVISVGTKPLYSDLFSYALDNLQNKICMIANSDIYIHELDEHLVNGLNANHDVVFALTRYEHDLSCPLIKHHCGSHDCFIFKSPLNFHDRIENIKHVQHHWGSEAIVLYEMAQNNIKLVNPCFQIKIVHLHKTGLREENRPRVDGGREFGNLFPTTFHFKPMDLSSLILGAPTDAAGFEKELNAQIAAITGDARDVEELIADALKRRCNCKNNCKAAMQMHLRLKMGANAEPREMTRRELGELTELVAAKGATNAIIQRLANFYARIAMLRARIEAILRSSSADPAANPTNPDVQGVQGVEQQLLAAYAKNEESLREKRDQNQRELNRIMRALFLDGDINPDLTEDDLPALETQVEHIAERGCIAQELRRVKIVEALLEQRRLDALLSQLHAAVKSNKMSTTPTTLTPFEIRQKM